MRAYIVIFPLLCFQCISAQCIGSMLDEFPAFANIPAEYLAMGNYGAMDFLPASDYYVTNMFPMITIPSLQDGIYGDRWSPCAIEPLNFDISSPFEPYAGNQALPSLAKPTGLSLPLEVSLSSTCPYNEQYSFNPFAYPTPSLYPAAAPSPVLNPFTYAAPSAAVSPPGFEVPLQFETPALFKPYTTPSLPYEAPNFIPSSPGFSSRISELIKSFTPSMNIKCLGGYGPSALAASKGRGFQVTSSSPIRPTGISIASENVYQGSVSVAGRLPFLGTVDFGGTLPSFGSGAVNYRCGNGNVAIVSEESNISERYPYLDTQYF